MATQHLRILVTKEDDMFVAQCLEHDIAVQAPNMETLQRRFEATVLLEGDLSQIEPAPEEFQRLWDEALELQSRFHNAEMRLAA